MTVSYFVYFHLVLQLYFQMLSLASGNGALPLDPAGRSPFCPPVNQILAPPLVVIRQNTQNHANTQRILYLLTCLLT